MQTVNQSFIFLKYGAVILSTGSCRIAIGVTLKPYENALSIIKGDLLEIIEHEQKFTSIAELSQIETLLATIESKLQAVNQI